MKTILVPIDFSTHSQYTAQFGVELARQINADVLLLHVVQLAPAVPALTIPLAEMNVWNNSMRDEMTVEMQQFRDDLAKQSAGLPPVTIHTRLTVGQPADAIVEIARAEKATFIVMGTVGASNAWEKLIGSVTADVIRNAEQPLWIIPNAVKLDSLRRFAYFADLEGDEVSCINQVIDLSELLRTSMKVVHISEPDEEEFSEAEAMIDTFEASYATKRITFQNLIYPSVVDGIESYVRAHWPDALVLAHRNRGLIGELFHKSLTRKLLLTTKRPLLVIRKPDLAHKK